MHGSKGPIDRQALGSCMYHIGRILRPCQVVMAVFSYLYLNNWAARHSVTVGYVLSKALQLEPDQMLDFFAKARRRLCLLLTGVWLYWRPLSAAIIKLLFK